jgi:protein-disulfide isomerase
LEPIFQQVLKKNPKEVKLVVKHFPLGNHKFASQAAKAALAANEQEKFWEFHQKLFENYMMLNDLKIQDIAHELGLDIEKFNNDMNSAAVANLINRDLENGIQIGVRGTPTIFVNGKFLEKRDLNGFSEMIEAEIKRKD